MRLLASTASVRGNFLMLRNDLDGSSQIWTKLCCRANTDVGPTRAVHCDAGSSLLHSQPTWTQRHVITWVHASEKLHLYSLPLSVPTIVPSLCARLSQSIYGYNCFEDQRSFNIPTAFCKRKEIENALNIFRFWEGFEVPGTEFTVTEFNMRRRIPSARSETDLRSRFIKN